LTHCIYYS